MRLAVLSLFLLFAAVAPARAQNIDPSKLEGRILYQDADLKEPFDVAIVMTDQYLYSIHEDGRIEKLLSAAEVAFDYGKPVIRNHFELLEVGSHVFRGLAIPQGPRADGLQNLVNYIVIRDDGKAVVYKDVPNLRMAVGTFPFMRTTSAIAIMHTMHDIELAIEIDVQPFQPGVRRYDLTPEVQAAVRKYAMGEFRHFVETAPALTLDEALSGAVRDAATRLNLVVAELSKHDGHSFVRITTDELRLLSTMLRQPRAFPLAGPSRLIEYLPLNGFPDDAQLAQWKREIELVLWQTYRDGAYVVIPETGGTFRLHHFARNALHPLKEAISATGVTEIKITEPAAVGAPFIDTPHFRLGSRHDAVPIYRFQEPADYLDDAFLDELNLLLRQAKQQPMLLAIRHRNASGYAVHPIKAGDPSAVLALINACNRVFGD